jgi:spore germination cell wall hydrolase CwlJ-like protein
MELVFYILQLLIPEQLSGTSQKAYISSLQSVYESYHGELYLKREASCLSRILYNETQGEGMLGTIMVAQVVVNRMKSGEYPSTACGNLRKKNAFSFYSPKTKDKKRVYPKYFVDVAEKALNGKYSHLLSKEVKYFKVCTHPSSFFQTKLKFVKKVDKHCMYKKRSVR